MDVDDDHSTSSSPPLPLPSDQNPPLLHRRSNTISAPFHLPNNLILPRHSSSSATFLSSGCDLDLISVKPEAYTSLKDLLPTMAVNSSMPNSPAPCQDPSSSQISIRNRLVKQAAWAYLQPMSTPTDSANRSLFKRLWVKLSRKNPVLLIFRFFSRAFDCLLSAIRIRSYR